VPLSVNTSAKRALRAVRYNVRAPDAAQEFDDALQLRIIPPVALPSRTNSSASSAVRRESFVSGSPARK